MRTPGGFVASPRSAKLSGQWCQAPVVLTSPLPSAFMLAALGALACTDASSTPPLPAAITVQA